MKAKITRVGNVTLVSIEGRLEIEKIPELRKLVFDECAQERLVLCLSELGFVGSYGITAFFQIIQELKEKNPFGVKISGFSRDFSFLMGSLGYQIDQYSSIDAAMRAYEETFKAAA